MNPNLFQRIYVALLLLVSLVFSQSTAVPFLLLEEVGAKARGLAGSFTALSTDASALYYNVAGLSQIPVASFVYDYYKYFSYSDIYLRYISAAYTIPDIGSFGISLNYFYLGENIRTDEYGNELGKFKSKEWAFTIGYSRKISQTISIGSSIKLIRSDLSRNIMINHDSGISTGYAIDLGILYTNFSRELCYYKRYLKYDYEKYFMRRSLRGPAIGIAINNIGPNMKYCGEEDPLPQQLRIGLSWVIIDTDLISTSISSDIRKLLVGGDKEEFYKSWYSSWENFSFNKLDFSIGTELSIFYFYSIRISRFLGKNNINYWYYGLSAGPETLRLDIYKKVIDNERYNENFWRMGITFIY